MSNKPYLQNQHDDFYADEFNSEEGNLFSNLLETYLPFWPWFVLSVGLCLAGANTYLRYANPDYEGLHVPDTRQPIRASFQPLDRRQCKCSICI